MAPLRPSQDADATFLERRRDLPMEPSPPSTTHILHRTTPAATHQRTTHRCSTNHLPVKENGRHIFI